MKVVVDIQPENLEEIRGLVRAGDYDDPDEFVERAIQTLLELESSPQGSLPSLGEAVGETSSTDSDGTVRGSSRALSDQPSTPSTDSSSRAGEPEWREILKNLSLRDFDVTTGSPPSSDRIDTGPLWGQYNRILPIKLTVRRLAVVKHGGSPQKSDYETFREETARDARQIGFELQDADDRHDRGRGEKFSAAFPISDKTERSLERFKTHFVGQMSADEELTGAPPTLKFVDIDPEEETFELTSAGLAFAELENPLLDEDLDSERSLSDEEREFYLDHVAREHEAEDEAMRVLAEAIASGVNRPDPLNERIGELSEDWTEEQATTVRTGLVGRMQELGLVTRERVGSRGVGYRLTDYGERELL